MIWGKEVDLKSLAKMSDGLIVKDDYFDTIRTLEQKDVEKWADCAFTFKFEYEGEWYLATFHEHHGDEYKVTLSVTKWVNE